MKLEGGVTGGVFSFFSYNGGRLSARDDAAKGCSRPGTMGGESRMAGPNTGEEAGDESVGPIEGEEGGEEEGAKGSPSGCIERANM